MHFSPLYGNESAKSFLQKLSNEIRNGQKNSSVLLFPGPAGVGKRSFALAFIQNLLGPKHAKKVTEEIHPDVKWIRPEGKTRMHPVSSIKEMLDDVPISSYEALKKVYVIEEAERMLPASSNTLLKTLEEPSSHVLFILLTSHEEEILPTILSRCVRVPFHSIEESVLYEALKQKCEPEKAKQIVSNCHGSFSKALEMLKGSEDPIKAQFKDILDKFFLARPTAAFLEALDVLEKLIEKRSKEEDAVSQILDGLFEDLLFFVRDLHYTKIDELQSNLPSLEKMFSLIEEARFALQRNSKAKVVLERLFAQSTYASGAYW